MNRTRLCLTLVLLRCVHGRQPFPKDVFFSNGTELFVKGLSSDPSVLILSSVDSGHGLTVPHTPMLVCFLSGLQSAHVDIIWWINQTVVDPKKNVTSTSGGTDGATWVSSLWYVPAEDWNPYSHYWCGVVHEGRLYRNGMQPFLCEASG